jgi:outer membrane protein TolC
MDEMKLAKAFYDVNQARSAFFPSLTLTATGEFTNNSGAGIVNPGIMIGQAVAALAQPIFANGQLRARLRISKEEFNIAKNNFVSCMINAGNEVNTAMVKVRSAEEMKELIDKQVKALETSYDANRKLYANSSANYLNVITAHNNLLSARMEQIANRMESISATVELYQALGGGAD